MKAFIKGIPKKLIIIFVRFFFRKKQFSTNTEVGVVSLLSHSDIEMFIIGCTTFFYFTKVNLPMFIISDGSLTKKDKELLSNFFTCHVLDPEESSKFMRKKIREFSFLSKYRFSAEAKVYKLKLDALILSPFKKCILLDADVLFFQNPESIIKWLKDSHALNLFGITGGKTESLLIKFGNPEIYFRRLLYSHLNIKSNPFFNAGILCTKKIDLTDLKNLDLACKTLLGIGYHNMILFEEVLLSTHFNLDKSKALDYKKYACVTQIVDAMNIDFRTAHAVHFAHLTKDLFYWYAIKLIFFSNFFYKKNLQEYL